MLAQSRRGDVVLAIIPATIVLASLGLSIGLTYAPCYASLCTEDFFPYETRLTVATFYALIGSIGAALLLCGYSTWGNRIATYHLTQKPVPYLGKRISVGGLLLFAWIAGLGAAEAAFWWPAAYNYYKAKVDLVDWSKALPYLAVTNLTGHHCDLLSGLVILPISRNSVLGRLFNVHYSSILFTHKVLAYFLLISTISHAVPYFAFMPLLAAQTDEARRNEFNIDNPILTEDQASARGYWSMAVLLTGLLGFLVLVAIVITSLPKLRRRNYNTFYYFHTIGGACYLIAVCLHASSNFYCLLPGILLWIYDCSIRTGTLLRPKLDATIEDTGNGWFRIVLPVRHEALVDETALQHPLQTYYLNAPDVSKLQNHAFTANKISNGSKGPEFVFRRAEGKKQSILEKEWTWKLAKLVTEDGGLRTVSLHTEGPYIPPTPELFVADHVLCITGGTGVTGANSLANYWLQNRASEVNSSFRLVWTVRESDAALLEEIVTLRERMKQVQGMDMTVHISSEHGRLNATEQMEKFFGGADASVENKESSSPTKKGLGWVYASGPEGLLDAAEGACVDYKSKMQKQSDLRALDWYIARWQV